MCRVMSFVKLLANISFLPLLQLIYMFVSLLDCLIRNLIQAFVLISINPFQHHSFPFCYLIKMVENITCMFVIGSAI
jgi:hypothetical protein